MDKHGTKKNKTAVITIRTTEKEKKMLSKKAKNNGMSLSEYLITTGLRYNMHGNENVQMMVHNTAIVQQVCNYVKENYGEAEYLEKWSEELWENLS